MSERELLAKEHFLKYCDEEDYEPDTDSEEFFAGFDAAIESQKKATMLLLWLTDTIAFLEANGDPTDDDWKAIARQSKQAREEHDRLAAKMGEVNR